MTLIGWSLVNLLIWQSTISCKTKFNRSSLFSYDSSVNSSLCDILTKILFLFHVFLI
jgi:hypothetical protein